MSVNYHAFQSRNILFSHSGAVCEQWRAAFSKYNPSRIAAILGLNYDEQYLYLTYFHASYRLCLKNGILEKEVPCSAPSQETRASVGIIYPLPEEPGASSKAAMCWTEELYFNETMALYHLLKFTRDNPQASGIWVPNMELDGASLRRRQADPLLTPFSAFFAGRAELLRSRCLALQGSPLAIKGDVAFLFHAVPQIPLRLIFWDEDEEFPAQTQVLVDSRVTDFLHYESVGCVVSDLLEKLEHGCD